MTSAPRPIWLPQTYQEVVDACARQTHAENTYTEFKSKSDARSERLAMAMAALAHHGGALIIGVDEDRTTHKCTAITAVNLRDTTERVADIASHSVDPVVHFRCTSLADASGTDGVLVVEVFPHPLRQ